MLLTKHDIARLARVKPRTVDSWIQAGLLKPIKAGPRLNRFLLADFERFLGLRRGTLKLLPHVASQMPDDSSQSYQASDPRDEQ